MAIGSVAYGNTVIYQTRQNGGIYAAGQRRGFDAASISISGAAAQEDKKKTADQSIDPLSVDPRNASFEEIQALNAYLVETGRLKESDLDSFEHPSKDDMEKADYHTALQKWRDLQYRAGNMVGYQNASKVCNAWADVIDEKEGKTASIDGIALKRMNVRLTSGIVGFGTIGSGAGMRTYEAVYASDSTIGNPVIEVRIREEGKAAAEVLTVCVNQVDPAHATQLEMFALCSHADAQQVAGWSKSMNSYQCLMSYAMYSGITDARAKNVEEFKGKTKDWTQMVTDGQIEKLDRQNKVPAENGELLHKIWSVMAQHNADSKKADMSGSQLEEQALLEKRAKEQSNVPYSFLAKDGIIEYEGVIFVCDEERSALCLGDVSNPDNCIRIPLSGGGCLIVNRDNIDDLAKAIGMFSPEDVKLILQAIAQDAKIQQMKNEIDEETSGIGLARDIDEAEAETEAEKLETEGISGEKETAKEEMSGQEETAEKEMRGQKETVAEKMSGREERKTES